MLISQSFMETLFLRLYANCSFITKSETLYFLYQTIIFKIVMEKLFVRDYIKSIVLK